MLKPNTLHRTQISTLRSITCHAILAIGMTTAQAEDPTPEQIKAQRDRAIIAQCQRVHEDQTPQTTFEQIMLSAGCGQIYRDLGVAMPPEVLQEPEE